MIPDKNIKILIWGDKYYKIQQVNNFQLTENGLEVRFEEGNDKYLIEAQRNSKGLYEGNITYEGLDPKYVYKGIIRIFKEDVFGKIIMLQGSFSGSESVQVLIVFHPDHS